jgi:hypothetical protein
MGGPYCMRVDWVCHITCSLRSRRIALDLEDVPDRGSSILAEMIQAADAGLVN